MFLKPTKEKLNFSDPEIKRALIIGVILGYCLGLLLPHAITLVNTTLETLIDLSVSP